MHLHRSVSRPRVALAAVALACLLGACAQPSAPAPDAAADQADAPVVEATPAVEPAAGSEAAVGSSDTGGGDGSPIVLDALQAQDIDAAGLPGELACVFLDGEGAPLLRAAGNVASEDPAVGIVKLGGVTEMIRAPGGFDGMLDDPTFSARGLTIAIRVTGASIGDGESPPRPATMTLQRADGASRSIDGRWECGP